VEAYKIQMGPFGERMMQALKDIVFTLAHSGLNIIIDDVSFGKEQVDTWREVLVGFNVLYVGVIAPIEIIERREKECGDRKLGGARWQAERVHIGVYYDVMIDTHAKDIDENVHLLLNIIQQ
jgi:chloramphenicol 3-O phosphotransferase